MKVIHHVLIVKLVIGRRKVHIHVLNVQQVQHVNQERVILGVVVNVSKDGVDLMVVVIVTKPPTNQPTNQISQSTHLTTSVVRN